MTVKKTVCGGPTKTSAACASSLMCKCRRRHHREIAGTHARFREVEGPLVEPNPRSESTARPAQAEAAYGADITAKYTVERDCSLQRLRGWFARGDSAPPGIGGQRSVGG